VHKTFAHNEMPAVKDVERCMLPLLDQQRWPFRFVLEKRT